MTPPGLQIGFFGKIPTRGDFVRHGLPTSFVRPLDKWFQAVLPGSRAILGDAWTDLWMEAPIWHALLLPGLCGPHAAAALLLPSTDRAGRLFPLVLALVAPTWPDLAPYAAPFLAAAEPLALTAIEHDVTPEQLAAALAALPLGPGAPAPRPRSGTWSTIGSTHVAPATRSHLTLPNEPAFAAMLRDEVAPTRVP